MTSALEQQDTDVHMETLKSTQAGDALRSDQLRRNLEEIEAEIAAKSARLAELQRDVESATGAIAEAATTQARALVFSVDAKIVAAAVKSEDVEGRRLRNARSAIGMLESELGQMRVKLHDGRAALDMALDSEQRQALGGLVAEIRPVLVDAFERFHAAASADQRAAMARILGGTLLVGASQAFPHQWNATTIDRALSDLERAVLPQRAPVAASRAVDLGPPTGVGILRAVAYRTAASGSELPAGWVGNVPKVVADRIVALGLGVRLGARSGNQTITIHRDTAIEIGGTSSTYRAGIWSVPADRVPALRAAGAVVCDSIHGDDVTWHMTGANSPWRERVDKRAAVDIGDVGASAAPAIAA